MDKIFINQILTYILVTYITLTFFLHFLTFFIEPLIKNKIRKRVNDNIISKYLNNDISEEIFDKMFDGTGVSLRTYEFILDFILCPIILLIPFLGQSLLFDIYSSIYNFFKVYQMDIETYCKDYVTKSLQNNNSKVKMDLELIEKYYYDEEKIVYNFLNNNQHPYYFLGFDNFITLINIIKEQEEQIPYMDNEDKKNMKKDLSLLIMEYIEFIKELNNNTKKKMNNSNSIKNYYELLKSMTTDLRNNKY